jgi:hypothetical protein
MGRGHWGWGGLGRAAHVVSGCSRPSLAPQAFNVLKYENSQHYDSHYDSFDPKEYGKQMSQRIATVLVYLWVARVVRVARGLWVARGLRVAPGCGWPRAVGGPRAAGLGLEPGHGWGRLLRMHARWAFWVQRRAPCIGRRSDVEAGGETVFKREGYKGGSRGRWGALDAVEMRGGGASRRAA